MIAFPTSEHPATYSHTLRRLGDEQWYETLDAFQDASIFQTIPFVTAKSLRDALEHLVVRSGRDVIAAAQVRVIGVPLTGQSIAYVFWGPMCQRRGAAPDLTSFRLAIRALREEYVVRRRMCLRITPCLEKESDQHLAVLAEEGFCQETGSRTGRTIVIDLDKSLEELRKGLDKKWRNCLNAAEKNALQIVEGSDDQMFAPFLEVYRAMLSRKRLAEPGDIRSFRAMHVALPERYKMRIFIARDARGPCAAAICSAIGNRGIYLFGGTADAGMKNKSSYLVQWHAIKWLKDSGCNQYDLHGINPKTNPGVYAFKLGLAGKNGREVEFVGNFDAYPGARSEILMKSADGLNHLYKRLKTVYGKYRGFRG